MNAGISTACLYPMETETALEQLLKMDFHLFEIFFNTYRELRHPLLANFKQILDEAGAKVVSVHPFTSGFETMLLFSDYQRRYLDGLDFYRCYFDAANYLGAKILVLHGQRDFDRSRISEELYFERYAQLYALGKSHGILVAQENVNAFRSESPEFIRRMRTVLRDECSFVLDVKQAVRAGFSPFDMCGAMGERLVHVHINDNDRDQDCLLPGEGSMDFQKLLAELQKFGYQGDMVIEVYRNSFDKLEELIPAKNLTEVFVRNFPKKA